MVLVGGKETGQVGKGLTCASAKTISLVVDTRYMPWSTRHWVIYCEVGGSIYFRRYRTIVTIG